MTNEQIIRTQLQSFLIERNAHANLEDVLVGFPEEFINSKIEGVEYSPWQLLEHMRMTQEDIIKFIENSDYEMPKWPEGYWPAQEEGTGELWAASVNAFMEDLRYYSGLLQDPERDLFKALPEGDKYTIFREVLVIIDHNSHHLGQMIMFRKHFGAWK